MAQQTRPVGKPLPATMAWHGTARHRSPRRSASCRRDCRHLPPQHSPSTGMRCPAGVVDAGQSCLSCQPAEPSSVPPQMPKAEGTWTGRQTKDPSIHPGDATEEPQLQLNANLIRAARYLTDLFTCLPAVGIPGEERGRRCSPALSEAAHPSLPPSPAAAHPPKRPTSKCRGHPHRNPRQHSTWLRLCANGLPLSSSSSFA